RQIGLAGPVVLETLPARDPRVARGGNLRQEGVHQGRLADSRLAGHEDDLPHAPGRASERYAHLIEFGLPANQPDGVPRRRRGPMAWPRVVQVAWLRARDEPVAAAVDRLHEPRHPRLVPERPSDLADAAMERGVGHQRAGPERVEKLLLPLEPAGTLNQ